MLHHGSVFSLPFEGEHCAELGISSSFLIPTLWLRAGKFQIVASHVRGRGGLRTSLAALGWIQVFGDGLRDRPQGLCGRFFMNFFVDGELFIGRRRAWSTDAVFPPTIAALSRLECLVYLSVCC